MDLLDFEATELYFQQEDIPEVQSLIQQAGDNYANGYAELPLLQAYLRSPESLNVLVALNRFYYYQHRLEEALLISEKFLGIVSDKIGFPLDWQKLEPNHVLDAPKSLLSWVRLYLFTLKSIGFLNMRLYHLHTSLHIFEKLVLVDSEDRIGAQPLLDLVSDKLIEKEFLETMS